MASKNPSFFRIFQHLLPRALAWLLLPINKQLSQFFQGLTGTGDDAKTFYDDVYNDQFAATTRELGMWDVEVGLRQVELLSTADRRERLASLKKTLGGQSLEYIQGVLQGAGFPVFLHTWYEPGTEPPVNVKVCVTPRNPVIWLSSDQTPLNTAQCGEPLAQCGEPLAQCGNSFSRPGYPLVNKISSTSPKVFTQCGEPLVQCGEPTMLCGNYTTFKETTKEYPIPLDPAKWPYFLYIGGQQFGTVAQISENRRDEFEALCLKICPAQLWLGIFVDYKSVFTRFLFNFAGAIGSQPVIDDTGQVTFGYFVSFPLTSDSEMEVLAGGPFDNRLGIDVPPVSPVNGTQSSFSVSPGLEQRLFISPIQDGELRDFSIQTHFRYDTMTNANQSTVVFYQSDAFIGVRIRATVDPNFTEFTFDAIWIGDNGSGGFGDLLTIGGSTVFDINVWYEVSLTFVEGVFTLRVDGATEGSVTPIQPITDPNETGYQFSLSSDAHNNCSFAAVRLDVYCGVHDADYTPALTPPEELEACPIPIS